MENQPEEKSIAVQDRMDYDGWWKDVIEYYWPDFLLWALPELYENADLSKKPEFLSKELRDTIHLPDGEDTNSAYFVDELVKIRMKHGGEEWVLLHIEIQGPGGKDISFRMMVYCCLIFGHFQRMPIGLAILTAPRPSERVGVYEAERYGSRMTYQYNHIEVFNLDDEELLSSDNPFRIALYAAKKAVLCKNEEKQKLIYLRELTRLLFLKGFTDRERRDVLLFIARIINLKDAALRQEYLEDWKRLKGEEGVKMTFIEEYFRNEGLEQGLEQGRSEGRVETLDAAATFMKENGISLELISKFKKSFLGGELA